MAVEAKTATKVVSRQKLVKEEIVRFTAAAVIAAGVEVEAFPFGGSAGEPTFEARIGECAELLAAGVTPSVGMERTRFIDRNQTEWNRFITKRSTPAGAPTVAEINNDAFDFGINVLPINILHHFEKETLSWGFASFLSEGVKMKQANAAPTWKIPEGDQIRTLIQATDVAFDAVAGGTTVAPSGILVVRRYLAGSAVDYKHFDNYDGGLKSNKYYWQDPQRLFTTVKGQFTRSWFLQLIKNEGYKFFTGGVAQAGTSGAVDTRNLVSARIVIDDPTTTYNNYFVAQTFNQLPFIDTWAYNRSARDLADLPATNVFQTQLLDRVHRFIPTIDVLKNRNRDLSIFVQDTGTEATKIYTKLTGVKYQL